MPHSRMCRNPKCSRVEVRGQPSYLSSTELPFASATSALTKSSVPSHDSWSTVPSEEEEEMQIATKTEDGKVTEVETDEKVVHVENLTENPDRKVIWKDIEGNGNPGNYTEEHGNSASDSASQSNVNADIPRRAAEGRNKAEDGSRAERNNLLLMVGTALGVRGQELVQRARREGYSEDDIIRRVGAVLLSMRAAGNGLERDVQFAFQTWLDLRTNLAPVNLAHGNETYGSLFRGLESRIRDPANEKQKIEAERDIWRLRYRSLGVMCAALCFKMKEDGELMDKVKINLWEMRRELEELEESNAKMTEILNTESETEAGPEGTPGILEAVTTGSKTVMSKAWNLLGLGYWTGRD